MVALILCDKFKDHGQDYQDVFGSIESKSPICDRDHKASSSNKALHHTSYFNFNDYLFALKEDLRTREVNQALGDGISRLKLTEKQ